MQPYLPSVPQTDTFWPLAQHARKLLVLDLGFLGDTVHLLPALWAIRQAWPAAELHVMVAEHVVPLLEVAPWIDLVWGYPRFPKGPKPWQDWPRLQKLRAARFDAVLNLNGSDRSCFLTWLSGAPLRLGRCETLSLKKRLFFTHPLPLSRGGKPVYEQHCEFLRKAGIPCGPPEYRIEIPGPLQKAVSEQVGIPMGKERPLVHVSPFTTQDSKELPFEVLAEVLNRLHAAAPEAPIVLSCAHNDRELSKLAQLKEHLAFEPHRVFAGSLGLLELVAVLSMSRLHLGGDSGGLHVAVMAGAATVSWFRNYEGAREWAPGGPRHVSLFGEASPTGIQGIHADSVVQAAVALLH